MNLVQIYECLCDRTRLRILNLLCRGPLCVCHLQDILGEPQVKISKHLAYLKQHGMVVVEREGNWRVYSLVSPQPRALRANLACLQDCAQEDKVFQREMQKLSKLRESLGDDGPACCRTPKSTKVPS
jgi:ArsR family transcriptional regulator